ncbi:hypothetical protein BESB_032480 [Besnoitia besnoiti]|uniref:Uncharacterized protein n=1 Tax=Besnoitia besnoiti TaxID=94643 RepID=A0A2A9M5G4_BESBE|nr:uncharacterized protein BESB_032480 [Besnoitia besnoiti]PFH30660.1 hypothetical protein BESB_032480 [Besnoitia besnoiti]
MVMKSTRELGSGKQRPSRSKPCIKYSGIQRIFEKPTFVYKLYEYHDIHFGSRLLNVSLYGIHGSDSCWPGTCLVTG